MSDDHIKDETPKEASENLDTDNDLKSIITLIAESLELDVESSEKRKKKHEIGQALMSIVNEFLDSFFVLGYDIEGNPHIIKCAQTIQKDEALSLLLMRVYANEASNGLVIGGE